MGNVLANLSAKGVSAFLYISVAATIAITAKPTLVPATAQLMWVWNPMPLAETSSPKGKKPQVTVIIDRNIKGKVIVSGASWGLCAPSLMCVS